MRAVPKKKTLRLLTNGHVCLTQFRPTGSRYGVLLHKSGRHDDAELHFRKAVELSPHHGDYLYNLAVLLHVVQHKFSEAIEVPVHRHCRRHVSRTCTRTGI